MYIKRPSLTSNIKKVASIARKTVDKSSDKTSHKTGDESGDNLDNEYRENDPPHTPKSRNQSRKYLNPNDGQSASLSRNNGRKYSVQTLVASDTSSINDDISTKWDDQHTKVESRNHSRANSHKSRSRRDTTHESDKHKNRNHHHKSKKSHSKSKKPNHDSSSSKPKVTIPTGINFRPGRLQSLTAKQEITLKQFWAHLLKYWGYDISISEEDLKYPDCFVASSISTGASDANNLARFGTRSSQNTTNSSNTKKKGGFFSAAPEKVVELHAPPDSPRLKEIEQNSSREKFIPTDKPDESVVNNFVNHYKLTFEYHKNYLFEHEELDDDVSDASSIESFVTASTTITYPDDTPTMPTKTGKSTTNISQYHSKSIPTTPINTHPTVNLEIARISPGNWQKLLINTMKHDIVDNLFLKFIRARKWELDDALKMITDSMLWRDENGVNEWIMESDGPSYLNGTNKGLIKNFCAEKSWIIGEDIDRNPIFWFVTKRHFGADAPADENRRYAVLCMEWCRFFTQDINESRDTFSIVFDLTGFTLKNADYTTIKFLAEAFEAHYPETLGKIYVHNAPWIFSTVWNIIKHWFDPVVAQKFTFTKNFKDLSNHVSPKYIPKELGGDDLSGPDYTKPMTGDDHPPKQIDSNYRKLMIERDELFMRLFSATIKWCHSTNPEVSSKYLQEKIRISIELSNNYLQLDPYIRNPGPYDRNNLLKICN
jgi:hypothetical protein